MWKWSFMITDWMIHDLDLHGNELLVYAIIYGFTKGGKDGYYEGQERIADMLNIELSTVNALFAKLKRRGLICDDPNDSWGGGKKKCFRCVERE